MVVLLRGFGSTGYKGFKARYWTDAPVNRPSATTQPATTTTTPTTTTTTPAPVVTTPRTVRTTTLPWWMTRRTRRTRPTRATTTTTTPATIRTLDPTQGTTPSSGGVTTDVNPAGSGCTCSQWSLWSDCSQACGGCGSIQRRRVCNKADCYDTEKRKCNFTPCGDQRWLWANGEFFFLWDGCCVGMFRNQKTGECGGIQNVFSEFISSFLPSLTEKRVPA